MLVGREHERQDRDHRPARRRGSASCSCNAWCRRRRRRRPASRATRPGSRAMIAGDQQEIDAALHAQLVGRQRRLADHGDAPVLALEIDVGRDEDHEHAAGEDRGRQRAAAASSRRSRRRAGSRRTAADRRAGVSAPPTLATRMMKNTTTWTLCWRGPLARSSGRIRIMAAPVVPTTLAISVPMAGSRC